MINTELLAPAGNMKKLKTAFYFGADAAYIGGKNFSLRSYSDNFTEEELEEAVSYAHSLGKKIYVTLNIFARNYDFDEIKKYLSFLESINADAAIISDPGIISVAALVAPKLNLHVSTQANTLNKYSAAFWAKNGAKRIILARELLLKEIKEIREFLPEDIELEAFCHGAMCISYSGRCLLSDYFTGRSSNRGECVQACRWNYSIREKSKGGEWFDIEEDERGTYILNSKDLNMISHLDEMAEAGVYSYKIEGRMKSEYYLATVVNAYRRAFDALKKQGSAYKNTDFFENEVAKTMHRAFTTAYMLGENNDTVNYNDSQSKGDRTFAALVLDYDKKKGEALIEMRNRFRSTDVLEVLTPNDYLNAKIPMRNLRNEKGEKVDDAYIVQQKLFVKTSVPLTAGDILRL